MTKIILIALFLIGQIYANENIICKENDSTDFQMADFQMICKEVSVIDFYSNEDSDIFYDKTLVDSIKLTDLQKSILNPAVIYILDDKSVALGACQKCRNCNEFLCNSKYQKSIFVLW